MNVGSDDHERERDSDEERVQTRFSTADSPSMVTIQAMAALKGVEPSELPPLHDALDPDALDALFADPRVFNENPVVATLTIDDCRVIIQNDGTLLVTEANETE